MAVMTPARAASAARRFEKGLPRSITRGLDKGMIFAHRTSITKYFRGGGKNPKTNPPRPPPGPLTTRTGNLRRDIDIVKAVMRNGIAIGGLEAGKGTAYARIHELGGMAGRRRLTRIPARPYLFPAIKDSLANIAKQVDLSVRAHARKSFGGVG